MIRLAVPSPEVSISQPFGDIFLFKKYNLQILPSIATSKVVLQSIRSVRKHNTQERAYLGQHMLNTIKLITTEQLVISTKLNLLCYAM